VKIWEKIKRHHHDRTLWSVFYRKLSAPFLLSPRTESRMSGSYSISHLNKGLEYDSFFIKRPGRRMVWEREQEVLRMIASQKGPFGLHLDFAGGTGRIAGVLEPYAHCQYVLDISQTMLSVAADFLTKATLINRDFRQGLPELENGSVDIVTAFRFFPNAEDPLRSEAMAFISKKLRTGGWLVCNNHRNFWSIPYIVKRFSFRNGDIGMTNRQMVAIAGAYGFRLMKTFSMGILPQSEDRGILPWGIATKIEEWLFRSSGTRQRLGYNIIFVFERI
jgi:hypothetical protein